MERLPVSPNPGSVRMRPRLVPSAARPLSLLTLLCIVIAGCSDDDNGGPNPVPTLVAIEVTPPTASVQAGGTAQFSAIGRMSDSSTSSVTVTWTATGGTITAAGSFTAGSTAGTYTVTATSGTRSGTASVTVTAVPPGGIALGLDFLPGSGGFFFPTYLTSPPGDTRLFVVERAGTIRIYKAGAMVATPFLDITSLVKSDAGEQGFVGLAFDPQYVTSGRFFVSYVNLAGESVLASYTVSANADWRTPPWVSSGLSCHIAHCVSLLRRPRLGPNGFLYMALGDGGESTDPTSRTSSTTCSATCSVSMWRRHRDTIPSTNPFVARRRRGEVWSSPAHPGASLRSGQRRLVYRRCRSGYPGGDRRLHGGDRRGQGPQLRLGHHGRHHLLSGGRVRPVGTHPPGARLSPRSSLCRDRRLRLPWPASPPCRAPTSIPTTV